MQPWEAARNKVLTYYPNAKPRKLESGSFQIGYWAQGVLRWIGATAFTEEQSWCNAARIIHHKKPKKGGR